VTLSSYVQTIACNLTAVLLPATVNPVLLLLLLLQVPLCEVSGRA
jgi:hypothetical protein